MKRALAHETHSSEGITAQLHIDPNDHPIVGQEAKFYFSFQDPEGNFHLDQCDCTITLLKDSVEIDKQPVNISDSAFATLGSTPVYSHTFAEPGTYELELTGNPKNGAIFRPFELDYDIQTQAGTASMADHHTFAGEHIGHILIFGGGFLIAIIILVRNYFQNRKQSN
jgi:hypothetical protein